MITSRCGAPQSADVRYTIIESPLGGILLAGSSTGLCRLSFQEGTAPLTPEEGWIESAEALREASAQLAGYFAGERRSFDLRLDLQGTPFQLRVWEALLKIPYGETATYGEIARSLGAPHAARAVGAAAGTNPLPVIVPCHRVVGAQGRLVGYRGGIGLKRRLLEIEGSAYSSSPSERPSSEAGRSAATLAASCSAHSRQRFESA